MKKIILGLIILIGPFFLSAHNPLSAVYRLESNDNKGVLNVYLTQAAVDKALVDIHGSSVIDSISIQGYKELIVAYVKSNFKLSINDIPIELKKGGIRYGNHETDLTFITTTLPKEINHLEVEITAFENNEYHQTIFNFMKNDGTREKIILNSGNDFKSTVNLKEEDELTYVAITLGIGVLILLLLAGLKIKKKKASQDV
ncbi:hypothetical protein N9Y48_03715 [Zobellia sp.]|nr:hypothetical protein [Zobellia sp.]